MGREITYDNAADVPIIAPEPVADTSPTPALSGGCGSVDLRKASGTQANNSEMLE